MNVWEVQPDFLSFIPVKYMWFDIVSSTCFLDGLFLNSSKYESSNISFGVAIIIFLSNFLLSNPRIFSGINFFKNCFVSLSHFVGSAYEDIKVVPSNKSFKNIYKS